MKSVNDQFIYIYMYKSANYMHMVFIFINRLKKGYLQFYNLFIWQYIFHAEQIKQHIYVRKALPLYPASGRTWPRLYLDSVFLSSFQASTTFSCHLCVPAAYSSATARIVSLYQHASNFAHETANTSMCSYPVLPSRSSKRLQASNWTASNTTTPSWRVSNMDENKGCSIGRSNR